MLLDGERSEKKTFETQLEKERKCAENKFIFRRSSFIFISFSAPKFDSRKVEISPLKIRSLRPIVVCELSPCLWNDFSFLSFLFYVFLFPPSLLVIRFRCQNICFYLHQFAFSRSPSSRVLSFVTNKGSFLLPSSWRSDLGWNGECCNILLCDLPFIACVYSFALPFMLHSMSSRNWGFVFVFRREWRRFSLRKRRKKISTINF